VPLFTSGGLGLGLASSGLGLSLGLVILVLVLVLEFGLVYITGNFIRVTLVTGVIADE